MDGIGGPIKNAVFRQVKTREVLINSPTEFCEAANKFVPLSARITFVRRTAQH